MGFKWVNSNNTPGLNPAVVPGGAIVNDEILIGLLISDSLVSSSVALPAGFTPFAGSPLTSDLDGMTFHAGWKKAASEAGNYVFTDTHNIIAAVLCMTGEDAVNFLHRVSSGSAGSPGDATPWDIISGAFATATAQICSIVFIAASDNNVSADVAHTAPAGFTMRLDFGNNGFFNGFIATKDAAAAGETGAYTATGTQVGGTAGFACLAVALQNAAGAASPILQDRAHSMLHQTMVAQ